MEACTAHVVKLLSVHVYVLAVVFLSLVHLLQLSFNLSISLQFSFLFNEYRNVGMYLKYFDVWSDVIGTFGMSYEIFNGAYVYFSFPMATIVCS